MKRTLLLVLSLTLLTFTGAYAAIWTEDFESGTSNWTINNGTAPITTGTAPVPHGTSLLVSAGQVLRVYRPVSSVGTVRMQGQFYDALVSTTTSRTFMGFQTVTGGALAVDSALIRIGKNNAGTYFLHYYTTALQVVALILSVGWHTVDITWNTGRIDYALDGTSGVITNAALTVRPNAVALGYNYSNGVAGSGVADYFDDITVVPEPGSLIALATGLIGLVGIRRRRA